MLEARPARCLRRLPGRETFAWPERVEVAAPGGSSAASSRGDGELPAGAISGAVPADAMPGATPDAMPDARPGATAASPVPVRSGMIVKRHEPSGGALSRLGLAPRPSAARREYEALAALSAAGLPVPRPFFWCEGDGRSAVAMELVEHRQTLRMALADAAAAEAAALLDELARLVARLHEAGWCHRDLYLEHVLVRRAPEPAGPLSGPPAGPLAGPPAGWGLVLIDLGRARAGRALRRRWFVKDLAALLHSTPAAVSRAARLRFLARYLDLRGLSGGAGGRAALRAWAEAVERKRARLATHRPRHGEHVPEHEAAERALRRGELG